MARCRPSAGSSDSSSTASLPLSSPPCRESALPPRRFSSPSLRVERRYPKRHPRSTKRVAAVGGPGLRKRDPGRRTRMTPRTLDDQLTKYLTDAHSIEEQALSQLRAAPKIAGDPELSRIFSQHLAETKRQEQLVRARLEQRG